MMLGNKNRKLSFGVTVFGSNLFHERMMSMPRSIFTIDAQKRIAGNNNIHIGNTIVVGTVDPLAFQRDSSLLL
jgi:hypothetical protein